ncbi:hypothetical protein CHS0354_015264 [Potamilus streckersoni]|uniref:Uncharacterized protein n=1 Tax=Potamilus streckersoni TaxID=2493646 RepID=A0AAE0RUH4_9BIVA|nr:hypothetical protein CHS0354_015264 [Potamilus streckersoni]
MDNKTFECYSRPIGPDFRLKSKGVCCLDNPRWGKLSKGKYSLGTHGNIKCDQDSFDHFLKGPWGNKINKSLIKQKDSPRASSVPTLKGRQHNKAKSDTGRAISAVGAMRHPEGPRSTTDSPLPFKLDDPDALNDQRRIHVYPSGYPAGIPPGSWYMHPKDNWLGRRPILRTPYNLPMHQDMRVPNELPWHHPMAIFPRPPSFRLPYQVHLPSQDIGFLPRVQNQPAQVPFLVQQYQDF